MIEGDDGSHANRVASVTPYFYVARTSPHGSRKYKIAALYIAESCAGRGAERGDDADDPTPDEHESDRDDDVEVVRRLQNLSGACNANKVSAKIRGIQRGESTVVTISQNGLPDNMGDGWIVFANVRGMTQLNHRRCYASAVVNDGESGSGQGGTVELALFEDAEQTQPIDSSSFGQYVQGSGRVIL